MNVPHERGIDCGLPEVMQGDAQMEVDVEELAQEVRPLGCIHALEEVWGEKCHIHSHLGPWRVLQRGCNQMQSSQTCHTSLLPRGLSTAYNFPMSGRLSCCTSHEQGRRMM